MNAIDSVPTSPPAVEKPVAAARAVEVDVGEQTDAWSRAEPAVAELCRSAARSAVHGAAADGPPAEISVLLADDAFVRDLNLRYRHRDNPTNVLSFPAGDGRIGAVGTGESDPLMLGDVVLAYETVAREAADQSKPLADHLAHLVVHGVLHLLGYDHESDADTAAMQTLEIRVLGSMGVADPYQAERPVDPDAGRPA